MMKATMNSCGEAERKVAELFACVTRRDGASSVGGCPVDLTASFVRLCLAQSCGKCVPCRVGLDRLLALLERILSGDGSAADLETVKACAAAIYDSADCAIGFEAARLVLDGLVAFGDDYASHVARGACTANFAAVPCQSGCPAHVDVPAYVACIAAGRYADAVRVIRRDNPFPSVCGFVCEHPCEAVCRRRVVDDAVNIRGLKRYAVEKAGDVPRPAGAPANGRRIGIAGGGPAGLTAAYFLALAGFEVSVFESRPKLGGMLRYGIPSYRLPDEILDRDIGVILSTGVNVSCGVKIGRDISLSDFRSRYDAVFISIGAQGAKGLSLDGEDAAGVLSAVELLGAVGAGERPDFTGKSVVVVGGGNVAMDATRTARRLGAERVRCVYRRRKADMTAQPEEVAGAEAEGCEIDQLMAPVRIDVRDGRVAGLVVRPQIPGAVRGGRPSPADATAAERVIPCDIVIVAIGQSVATEGLASGSGVDLRRGTIAASDAGEVQSRGARMEGVFTGGDCLTGPATVIRAIDAGKVAAANIAQYLGCSLKVPDRIDIPDEAVSTRLHWGRVNMSERPPSEGSRDFSVVERGLTDEEARQECERCLRCDRCGFGLFRR